MTNIASFLKILRPHQWVKNLFVFIPMFFGGSLLDTSDILASFITFLAFSLTASSVYCFNDIIDADADRRHPAKCHRPIASGAVSRAQGYILMAATLAGGIATTLLLPQCHMEVMTVIGSY